MESPFQELQNLAGMQPMMSSSPRQTPANQQLSPEEPPVMRARQSQMTVREYGPRKKYDHKTQRDRSSSVDDTVSPQGRTNRNSASFTSIKIHSQTPDTSSEIQVPITVFDLRESPMVKGAIDTKPLRLERNQRIVRSNSFEKKLKNSFNFKQGESLVVCRERDLSSIFDEKRNVYNQWEMSVDALVRSRIWGEHFYAILLNASAYKQLQQENKLKLLLISKAFGERDQYMSLSSSEIQIDKLQDQLCSLFPDIQKSEFALIYRNQKPDKTKNLGYYADTQTVVVMSMIKSRRIKVTLKYKNQEDMFVGLEMKCYQTCTIDELQKLFNEMFSPRASTISPTFNDGEALKISLIDGNRDKNAMLFYEAAGPSASHIGYGAAFYPVNMAYATDMIVQDHLESDVDLPIHVQSGRGASLDVDISKANSYVVSIERINKIGVKSRPVFLMVTDDQNIQDLKTKVRTHTKIPEDAQKLTVSSKKVLENENISFKELGLFKSSGRTSIYLEEYQSFDVTVQFKSLDRNDLHMQVYPGTKINQIISKIAEGVNCSIWQVCLQHGEHEMPITQFGDKTLSQCSISQDICFAADIFRNAVRVSVLSSNQKSWSRTLLIINPDSKCIGHLKIDVSSLLGVKPTAVNLIFNNQHLSDDESLKSCGIQDGSRVWAAINQEGQLKTRIFECEDKNGAIHESAGIVIGGHILKGAGNLTPEILQLLLDRQSQDVEISRVSHRDDRIVQNKNQQNACIQTSPTDEKSLTSSGPKGSSAFETSTQSHRPGVRDRKALQLNINNSSSSMCDSALPSSELDSDSATQNHGLLTSHVFESNLGNCHSYQNKETKDVCQSSLCSSTSVSQQEIISQNENGVVTSTCQQVVTTMAEGSTSAGIESNLSSTFDSQTTSTVIARNHSTTALVAEGNDLAIQHTQHTTWKVSSNDMNRLAFANENLQLNIPRNESLHNGLKSLVVSNPGNDFLADMTSPEPGVMPVNPPHNCVSDKLLYHVAKELGKDGLKLGRSLCLSDSELDALRRDHDQDTLEFNYQILRRWKEKLGYQATKDKLAKALKDSSKYNIVDQYLSDSTSENECQK